LDSMQRVAAAQGMAGGALNINYGLLAQVRCQNVTLGKGCRLDAKSSWL
jgi:hypothetical protein